MIVEEARQLAEEHWKWVESLLHKIYVDAFVHGITHGQEDEGTMSLEAYLESQQES